MTCIALGIILSVTKKEEEIAQETADKQKREDALKKLIDKQLEEDELEVASPLAPEGEIVGYTIEDKSGNPMTAIKGVYAK